MSFTLVDNTIHSPSDLAGIINAANRAATFLVVKAKTALFTIWTDDVDGSPVGLYRCTGTYAATLVAANSADAVAGRIVRIKNNGSGSITVTPDGSDTIKGASTLVLGAAASTMLVSDGTSDWMEI
jgi:hypothetical protein